MLLISTEVGIGPSRDSCNSSLEGRVTASALSSGIGGMAGPFKDSAKDSSGNA